MPALRIGFPGCNVSASMLFLIPLLLIPWTLGWAIFHRLRTSVDPRREGSSSASQVSIIIPARNEVHNLPRLLESIRSQPEAPLEVIVVDDHSTDGTAAIARDMGARVIASAPLPDGWRGKTWACHQGAQAARGERLCFLDADTWFESGGLARWLALDQGAALSIGPWHEIQRPYESLSLFFNIAMVAGTVPKGLFGQALLIDRRDYARSGGHEGTKSHILENVHLRLQLDAAGIPSHSAPGRGMIRFRMYPGGIRELIEGWTKGFASGANHSSALWLIVLWMIGLMASAIGLAVAGEPAVWAPLYLLYALQVGLIARRIGSFPWPSALLFPIPLLFFFAIFSRSARKGGHNVTWKGRTIDAH